MIAADGHVDGGERAGGRRLRRREEDRVGTGEAGWRRLIPKVLNDATASIFAVAGAGHVAWLCPGLCAVVAALALRFDGPVLVHQPVDPGVARVLAADRVLRIRTTKHGVGTALPERLLRFFGRADLHLDVPNVWFEALDRPIEVGAAKTEFADGHRHSAFVDFPVAHRPQRREPGMNRPIGIFDDPRGPTLAAAVERFDRRQVLHCRRVHARVLRPIGLVVREVHRRRAAQGRALDVASASSAARATTAAFVAPAIRSYRRPVAPHRQRQHQPTTLVSSPSWVGVSKCRTWLKLVEL